MTQMDQRLQSAMSVRGLTHSKHFRPVASALGALAVGPSAFGALVMGASAIGALAIGAFAIRRLIVREARIAVTRMGALEIRELYVGRLHVAEVASDEAEAPEPHHRLDRRPPPTRRSDFPSS